MKNQYLTKILCELVFDSLSEGILITDEQSKIIAVNEAFVTLTGFTEEEAVGQNPSILKSNRHNKDFYIKMWADVHKGDSWQGEIWNQKKTGEVYLQKLNIKTIRDKDHKIIHYVGIFSDMRLALNAKVFENASEGIMITSTEGSILSVNPAFTTTTGYSSKDVIGKSPRLLHSGAQDQIFYVNMWTEIHDKGCWQGEIWNRRKNGEVYPEWLSINTIKNENNEISNYVGIFSDITNQKKSEESLKFLAHYDVLTGLPNRLLFHDRMNQILFRANKNDIKFALLFIDLDRFKLVNDTFGHSVGDELLKQVANRFKECIRISDTLARIGGDEFIIILPDIQHTEDILKIAQKLTDKLQNEAFILNQQRWFIEASIGISVYPADGKDIDALIKNADIAMYKAKVERNSYQFFSPEIHHVNMRKMKLDKDLHNAIQGNQLEVYYQPFLDNNKQNLNRVEALLRWKHPELGMISPSEFITIAEENGSILKIGEWVLKTACKHNKEWQKLGLPLTKIFVNLSVRELLQQNFIEKLMHILSESELDACYLGLEITESIEILHDESFLKLLHEFKKLGIEIALDDFGTRHSALSYIKRFPVSIIKIDRTFIHNIETDISNVAIVKGIVSMAHGMGLKVVAEGVENETQSHILKELHCDYLQGYLFSRPLSANSLKEYFTKL